jgi:hypothetical protein
VSGRLARARDLLRGRLLRRGLAPSVALLAALPSRNVGAETLAALSEVVVRAAAAFASRRGVRDGLISGSAITLANEVIRSMMLIKWKVGSLVLLVLAVAGTSAAVFAPRLQPEKHPEAAPRPAKAPVAAKADSAARPPLKKEWVGRWQRDPFAGTTAIEIDGPGNRRLTDPQKVAALMKKLTIRAFHNGMARDFPFIARLTFIKKDQTRAYQYSAGTCADARFSRGSR